MNKSVPLSLIAALPFFAVNASAAEDVALEDCGPIPSLEAPGYDEETVKGQLNLEVGGLLKKVASAVFGAQAEETKKRLYQIPDIYYAQQKDKYLLRMFCASLWEDTSMSSAQRTAAITAYMSAPVPSTGLAAIPKPAEPAPKTSSYLICHGELRGIASPIPSISMRYAQIATVLAGQIRTRPPQSCVRTRTSQSELRSQVQAETTAVIRGFK